VGSKLNLSTLYLNFSKILGVTLTFHFSKYRSLYLETIFETEFIIRDGGIAI
jgi:hypothetical protein